MWGSASVTKWLFPGRVSLVAQRVKNLPGMQKTSWQSLGGKIQYTHCSSLAWRIPWTEESGRLQSMDCIELDMTERLTLSLFTFFQEASNFQSDSGTKYLPYSLLSPVEKIMQPCQIPPIDLENSCPNSNLTLSCSPVERRFLKRQKLFYCRRHNILAHNSPCYSKPNSQGWLQSLIIGAAFTSSLGNQESWKCPTDIQDYILSVYFKKDEQQLIH